MKSVKTCIEEIVIQNSFLEDALYYNYLNLTSFAEYIKPRLEKELVKDISVGSIKIALSRIAKEKQRSLEKIVFQTNNFFIKKDIEILNIPYDTKTIEKITLTLNKKVDKKEYYFSIVSWNSEINIIFCSEIRDIIYEIVNENDINISIKNLGAIGIYLNERMLETKGMFYTITKKLAFAWINVMEIVSTYKEIVIFVKEEDIKESLNVLIS